MLSQICGRQMGLRRYRPNLLPFLRPRHLPRQLFMRSYNVKESYELKRFKKILQLTLAEKKTHSSFSRRAI
jgi:hypothetical protein